MTIHLWKECRDWLVKMFDFPKTFLEINLLMLMKWNGLAYSLELYDVDLYLSMTVTEVIGRRRDEGQ